MSVTRGTKLEVAEATLIPSVIEDLALATDQLVRIVSGTQEPLSFKVVGELL